LVVRNVSDVIIHGITIRGCKPAQATSSESDDESDEGDGIAVFHSTHVWVDHCTLEACADGLIDVTGASTNVTLSNNILRNHNKTILLGHSDDFTDDKNMKVTVAFNRFGPGLVQRMPRCMHDQEAMHFII
jgi:pectate lyase